MIKRILLVTISMGFALSGGAQSFDKSLLFTDDGAVNIIPEDHFRDSSNWVVYLPSFSYHASQKGPKVTDYLYRDDQNRLLIDPNRALQNAADENIFQSGGRVNVLSAAWRSRQLTVSAGYGVRYISELDYPLQTLSLYSVGNALIFGERLDLSFDALAQAMHSYHIGASYKINRFTVGGQLAYLSGISDLSVSTNKLNIEVAPLFFGISIDNDFQLNTTRLIDYQGLDEILVDYSGDLSKSFFSSNTGISLSFALQFEIDRRSHIKIRVSDIGSINWTEAPQNFSSVGQARFGGVNLIDLINPDNEVSYRDSLESLLNIVESSDPYTTRLPISMAAACSRSLTERLNVTLSGSMVHRYDRTNYAVGIAGQYQVHQLASISASLTHAAFQSVSMGLGVKLWLGPVHLYAVTQNISALFNQLDAHFNYSSIGANVSF